MVPVVPAFSPFQQWQSLWIAFKTVGLPTRGEDLSAFGNYFGSCGTRSSLLNSFTNYVFNVVSVELIPGRRLGVLEGSFSRLVYKFEFLK